MKKSVNMLIDEKLLEAIDYYSKQNLENRTVWVTRVILKEIKSLGYDVSKLFEDEKSE
jgi:hypothetical protein